MSTVDAFIERAEKIYEKFGKAQAVSVNARRESRVLLEQLEKFLKIEGLEVPETTKRGTRKNLSDY